MGEIFERSVPDVALEWTGERLTSATSGQVEVEHLHRYFLARAFCRGRDVLDIACGEGYGSALMAQVARSVVGVDVSRDAVDHAGQVYRRENLRYLEGDTRAIPLPDDSVDILVSFETLEHFFEHDRFMEEALRVLRQSGVMLISSPERDIYSPPGSDANPYHANELSRVEFERLLKRTFAHVQIVSQRPIIGSALIVDDGAEIAGTLTFEKRGSHHYEANRGLPRAPYLVAFASNEVLPAAVNSLFIETDQVQQLSALPQLREEIERHAKQAEVYEREAKRAESVRLDLEGLREEVGRQAELRQFLQAENARYAEQAEVYEREARKAKSVRLDLERRISEILQDGSHPNASTGPATEPDAGVEPVTTVASGPRTLQMEIEGLRKQRDLLRRIVRLRVINHGVVPEGDHGRLKLAEAEAAEWKERYEALRARLITILRRTGILYVARVTPRFAKRFVRERLLAGGRP